MIANYEIIMRIVLSTIFGGLIGMEREVSNRPAGLRTHILVSLGSTLIMLVSIDGFNDVLTGAVLSDPARLAAQVVSGVGFLGAGTILRTGNRIKGLTTAASLWVSAGIGLAIGSGYYLGAVATVIMVLITLKALSSFEERVFRSEYRILEVSALDRTNLIGEITSILGKNKIPIKQIKMISLDDSIDRDVDVLTTTFKIKLPVGLNIEEVFKELCQVPGILEIFFEKEIDGKNYSWSKS